jgi:catechol 2,3-dioxygenase-like lactoylglutathione lyase family enzyme
MSEVSGIDHLYLSVADLDRSERFYDVAMAVLGFRKNRFALKGEPHVQYYNRHFGLVLRPARRTTAHDAYAPGLHHLCLRVADTAAVDAIARELAARKIPTSAPQLYPDYAPDYYAIHFSDPDGLRLEITNYRQERRARHDHWDVGRDREA